MSRSAGSTAPAYCRSKQYSVLPVLLFRIIEEGMRLLNPVDSYIQTFVRSPIAVQPLLNLVMQLWGRLASKYGNASRHSAAAPGLAPSSFIIPRSPGSVCLRHAPEKCEKVSEKATVRQLRITTSLRSRAVLRNPHKFVNKELRPTRRRLCWRCTASSDSGPESWRRTSQYMRELMASAMTFVAAAPER